MTCDQACLRVALNHAVQAVYVFVLFGLASMGWFALKRMMRGEK